MWLDSHCHVTADQFAEDREDVLERAFADGVEALIAIGAGYGIAALENTFDLGIADPGLSDLELDSRIAGASLVAGYDSRDNTFSPHRGIDAEARTALADRSGGDARLALNALEVASVIAAGRGDDVAGVDVHRSR